LFAIAAAAQAQTANEIVQRVSDALGTAAQFSAIRGIRVHGMLGGSAITVDARRPFLFHVSLMLGPNRTFLQGYDGSFAWQQAPGEAAKRLAGAEFDRVLDQAANAIGGPLVEATARANRVEFQGHVPYQGKDCIKLKVTLLTGNIITEFIDPATYLQLGEELTSADGKGPVIEETVGEYKRFGGVLFPTLYVSRVKGDTESHEFRITDIEINPVIDGKLFAMPAVH
jgi:hypothetical protein